MAVLLFAAPQELSASCCSSGSEKTACHMGEQEHEDKAPCGSSSCDCICCGVISLVLLKKEQLETESSEVVTFLCFSYESLKGSLFHSLIWQPPKLG